MKDNPFYPLFRQYKTGLWHSFVSHTAASVCYTKAATMPSKINGPGVLADKIKNDRKTSVIKSVVESANAFAVLSMTGETFDEWMARDGHIDYIANQFEWLFSDMTGGEDV
jgi:hypothetical protein